MFDTLLSLETEKEEEKEEEEEERGERWRRQGTTPVSRADPAWPQGWTQDTHAPGGCEDTYPPDGCQNSHAVGRCLEIRDKVMLLYLGVLSSTSVRLSVAGKERFTHRLIV